MGTLVVVSGASRGLGRAIAVEYASNTAGCHFVLLGRDTSGLAATQALIAAVDRSAPVLTHALDLAAVDTLPAAFRTIMRDAVATPGLGRALLVNNAGSTGDISKRIGEYPEEELAAYFNANVTSVAIMTSVFLKATASIRSRVIVNISSLLAVQASSHWGVYCTGKAARDMLHAVVAKEESVRTLNYAPGPLVGDMQAAVRASLGDESMRQVFASLHEKGQLVKMEDSAAKLVRLLRKDSFASGSHVDYYDDTSKDE